MQQRRNNSVYVSVSLLPYPTPQPPLDWTQHVPSVFFPTSICLNGTNVERKGLRSQSCCGSYVKSSVGASVLSNPIKGTRIAARKQFASCCRSRTSSSPKSCVLWRIH